MAYNLKDKIRQGYQKLRDATTIDEKFMAGINRVKSQPLSTYNITNPNTFAKAWNKSAPYNILNPGTFAKTARSGSNTLNFVASQPLPQQNNPILRGLGSAGQAIVRNTGQGLRAMSTGIEQRRPLTFAAGAFRTAAPVIGAGALPAYSLGGMALGGAVGALTNKDRASGFGSGAVQGLKTAAVTRFTDPVISKGLSKLAPGASLLKRQVAQRVGGGLANVAEDEIIARIDQLKTSTPEKALSFIIGAGVSGNDQLIDAAKKALRSGNKKQIKKVANTLADELQAKYKGKTPPGYRSTRGSNQYVNIVEPNKPKFSSDLNRQLGLDPYPKNALQDLNAVGAVAGFEQDEGGKWRYNPTKGAAGLAVATLGTKAAKSGDIADWKLKLSSSGYTPDQISKIKPKEAIKILKEGTLPFEHKTFKGGIKLAGDSLDKSQIEKVVSKSYLNELEQPTVKRWFNRVFNPIKNAPKDVQNIMQNWRSQNIVARTKANEVAGQFSDIPEEDGWKLIRYIQNPTKSNAKRLKLDVAEYQNQIGKIRQFYDVTREEGLKSGLDVGYLDNYLNQVWKETPNQIDAKIKAGAGKIPGFTKERSIPSYEAGVKLGLTPKFTHPAQLAAHYRLQLDKALANRKMADDLIGTGRLLPSSQAPANWKAIDSPFFPKAKINLDNRTIISDYKAPPDVAKAINNIFEVREPGLLDLTSKLSKGVQEIVLSGGIPMTPVNSFTLANIQKEVLSGRVKGPTVATALSFSDNATKRYFTKPENAAAIKEMASEGISTYTNTDYTSMYKNLAEKKGLWGKFGEWFRDIFDKSFNEPTFKRFMPVLQVEFYKDAYRNALSEVKSPDQAKKIAAEATKKFYGIADVFTRSSDTENLMSTFVMAPRFREAMINFWGSTFKSILDPKTFKDPAYSANRKFIGGVVLTWMMYNIANKAINGRWMHENKPGKELSLEIPLGGGRSFFMPLLPTIGTVPRRGAEAIGELAGGDIAGATQKLSSFASIPVSAGAMMLTNRNFYGAPLYQEDDPAHVKIGKTLATGAGQVSHPWIRTGLELGTGQRTLKESIPGMLELPLYPSASSDVAHLRGGQWKTYKNLLERNPEQAQQYARVISATQQGGLKKKFADMFGVKAAEKATPETISNFFAKKEAETQFMNAFKEIYKSDLDKQTRDKLIREAGGDPVVVEAALVKSLGSHDERVEYFRWKLAQQNTREEINGLFGALVQDGTMTKNLAQKMADDGLVPQSFVDFITAQRRSLGLEKGKKISIPSLVSDSELLTAFKNMYKAQLGESKPSTSSQTLAEYFAQRRKAVNNMVK